MTAILLAKQRLLDGARAMKYRKVHIVDERLKVVDVMDVEEYDDDECKRCSRVLSEPQTMFTLSDGKTSGTVCIECMIFLTTGKIPEIYFKQEKQ